MSALRGRSVPLDTALIDFVERAERLVVLTGAGVSTDCGIPDYRDADGEWKRAQPIQFREFVDDPRARQRYWARSVVGWPLFGQARPGLAHEALAALERVGRVRHLITQNVDGLHRRAGSRRVIDLHGTLDHVECLGCGERSPRAALQRRLETLNPGWQHRAAQVAPDGDVDLAGVDYASFRVADCERCAGVLKPTVVFFGESVPRARVEQAMREVGEADALLVAGSSLMVFSGYRFVREASRLGLPTAALNLGRTRADAELALKVEAPCGEALAALAGRFEAGAPATG